MKKALLFLSLFTFLGFASCEEDRKEAENNTPKEIKYTIVWDGVYPLTDIIINECDKNNSVKKKRSIEYIPEYSNGIAQERTFYPDDRIVNIEIYSKSNGQYFYDYSDIESGIPIFLGKNKITLEQYNSGISR